MPQSLPPRTSQLYRVMGLEHGAKAQGERLEKLEKAYDAFDLKLDGVLEVLLQVKGGLWLAGKIGAGITTLAIVTGAVLGVWHALGH